MRRPAFAWIPPLTFLTAVAVGCQDQGPPPPPPPQLPKPDLGPVREWLAKKGFAPVNERTFAMVGPRDHEKGNPEPGFLLASAGTDCRVLMLDFALRTGPRADFEIAAATLADHVKNLIAAHARDPRAIDFDFSRTPRPRPLSRLLLLASACAESHHDDLADRLLRICAGMADRTKPLVTQLADDLAAVAMWRLMLEFDDPARSWEQLQEQAAAIVRDHGDTRFGTLARNLDAVLQRMVTEARGHVPPAADTDEARIGELIYRLREQNGKQAMQPGGCMVFGDPRGKQSPAALLAAFGMKAVPFLLPVLDDATLTHSIEFHRDFYFSHRVLTVGAVARAVFQRITDHAPIDRADGERWWATYQAKGETAVLVDGAMRGSGAEARRLVLKDPQVALAVLPQAIAGLPPGNQLPLIAVLSGIADDQALTILREYLLPHNQPYVVPVAAAGLMVRGKVDEAVDGLVAVFQNLQEVASARVLAGQLIATGRRRALAAVAARTDLLDSALLAVLGSGGEWTIEALAPDGSGKYVRWTPTALEAGFDDDAEQLLGRLVGDPARAEAAARAMATRWPERYTFTDSAPAEQRKRQLEGVREAWRKRAGK